MTRFYYELSRYASDFFLVYEHTDSGNLLNERNMRDVCTVHKTYIESIPNYSSWFWGMHHAPNYIALLAGRSHCENITQADVDSFKALMQKCVSFYKNGALSRCLQDETKCSEITDIGCREDSRLPSSKDVVRFVYNVFQFLADKTYADNPSYMKLTGSADLIIFSGDIEAVVFKPLFDSHLNDLSTVKVGDVQVVAFSLWNLKFYLFQTEIIIQSLFIIAAIIIVILFIWFFSGSLFIGLMTLACIIIALGISYFVYGRVFDMNFFPFLNMVTLVFIVGIGADDAFVYSGIWGEALKIYGDVKDFDERLIKCTIHAIRHALVAMFVTSLTTASAFYANVSSVVTSVKCFGLFAGTAIIVNYLLMVTFFPVVVVLHEKYFGPCMHRCCPTACKDTQYEQDDESKRAPSKMHVFLENLSHSVFENHLPKIILKGKYLWIVVLLAIGIGGCVVTFAEPGLNPPSTGDFQMFIGSNPLEQFDLNYKRQFAFGTGSDGNNRQIFFTFGVEPEDNGYKFNPDDLGTLQFKPIEYLDLGASQTWIRQFCYNILSAPFIRGSPSCINLELFFKSLEDPCTYQASGCCNKSIPMNSKGFMECFRQNIRDNPPSESDKTKPIFDRRGNLKSLLIAAESSFVYSDEFKYNQDASNTVDEWFDAQTKNVTSSSFDGWWYIFNTFYDLQLGLFEGTKQSLGKMIHQRKKPLVIAVVRFLSSKIKMIGAILNDLMLYLYFEHKTWVSEFIRKFFLLSYP